MDRDYIVEHDIISRYVAGSLPTEEEEAFELAFFNDEELAALVLVEQGLRGALAPHGTVRRRSASDDEASRGRSARRPHAARRRLLPVALVLAAVAVPITWLVGPWQGPLSQPPRVLTQVLSLDAARSPRPGSGPSLPWPTTRNAVVALHIDAAQVPAGARRAMLIPDGLEPQLLAEFDGREIDASNGLIIEVPAKRLAPGAYALQLQDTESRVVQTLPFRITPP